MKNKIILSILIIIYFVVFFYLIDKPGVTWDEYDYIQSSQNHFKLIKNYSNLNHKQKDNLIQLSMQHPALARWIQGFFYKYIKIYKLLYLNFRLGNLIFLIGFLFASYKLITNLFNIKIYILFLILNLLNPKFLFYIVLGTMDFPVLVIFLLISAYYFSDFKKKSNIILFICFIIAGYAIKINSIVIIGICFISALLFNRKKLKILIPGIILTVFTLYLFYPLLWLNPIKNYKAYLNFHFKHVQNYEYYFHKIYNPSTKSTPWHYPVVHFATNLTEISVILCILGSLSLLKKLNKEKYFFIMAVAWSQIIVLLKPGTPGYNGIRLFYSSIPFLNLTGAIFLYKIFTSNIPYKNFIKGSILIIFAITLIVCYQYRKYPASYYNYFIGGSNLADNTGLQIDIWGENLNIKILNFINKNIEKNRRIFIAGNHPNTPVYLQSIGLLDKSLKFNKELFPQNIKGFDYFILLNNKSLWPSEISNENLSKKNLIYVLKNYYNTPLAYIIKN